MVVVCCFLGGSGGGLMDMALGAGLGGGSGAMSASSALEADNRDDANGSASLVDTGGEGDAEGRSDERSSRGVGLEPSGVKPSTVICLETREPR